MTSSSSLTADEVALAIERLRNGQVLDLGYEEDNWHYSFRDGHFVLDTYCRGQHFPRTLTEDELRAEIARYPSDFRQLLR